MMAACYSMDLYCDNAGEYGENCMRDTPDGIHAYSEFPHLFTGETFGECKRDAQKRGWRFTRSGKHYCPKCPKVK